MTIRTNLAPLREVIDTIQQESDDHLVRGMPCLVVTLLAKGALKRCLPTSVEGSLHRDRSQFFVCDYCMQQQQFTNAFACPFASFSSWLPVMSSMLAVPLLTHYSASQEEMRRNLLIYAITPQSKKMGMVKWDLERSCLKIWSR